VAQEILAATNASRAKPLLDHRDRFCDTSSTEYDRTRARFVPSLDDLKERSMTKVLTEVLAANKAYAENFGDKGKLPLPPGRRFAILTCMDARLDPAKFAGLEEGDAHVIRNAGGRASDDAIRSLVISHKLLGTEEWLVVHHTNCGMELFTDEVMRSLLKQSLDTAKLDAEGWRDVGRGPGSAEADFIDWLTISDQAESVASDVRRIRAHPLVPASVPIYGYVYDVKNGRLIEVPKATKIGQAA
jgi:carbonic anhydrase